MNKRVQKVGYYDKLPPNTKLVCRPSRWGNPYRLGEHTRGEAIRLYRVWLDDQLKINPHFLDELIGHDIACFCKLKEECHADVILERLNSLNSSATTY